ncbi:hypothetical protein [Sedimentimonas flavescens]|uniref:hypothetical protein n=1 Tax=Sedimentimonas flavescens TaxID=2851012 RepID=UPI001F3692D7|nr:hypothetical protein [Sedimentimonas flavescens]
MRKGDLRFAVANTLGPSAANRAFASAAVSPDWASSGASIVAFIPVIHHASILALQRWWFKRPADTLISVSAEFRCDESQNRKVNRGCDWERRIAAFNTASYSMTGFKEKMNS